MSISTIEQLGGLEQKEREKSCRLYATDTWHGISLLAQTATGFPVDRMIIDVDGKEVRNSKTSPTNIGLYLASIVGARDLELLSSPELHTVLEKVFTSLEHLPKHEGLFFNWYDPETLQVDNSIDPGSTFLSTVDNAWIAAGLMVVEAAVPEFSQRAHDLIKGMNFSLFYDDGRDLFYGGYNSELNQPTNWHYGVLNTEARIAGYVGVGRFGIPEKHFQKLGRSVQGDATNMDQSGETTFLSWKGSVFEALMPSLFVPENRWSPIWQKNLQEYLATHIEYGKKNLGGYWGISTCDDPLGNYVTAGLIELGMSDRKDLNTHFVTPHAVMLSLGIVPEQALFTLNQMKANFPIYTESMGFSDSLDPLTGEVSNSYLSLDQEMSFLQLSNLLSNNNIQRYFTSSIEDSVRGIFATLPTYLHPDPS